MRASTAARLLLIALAAAACATSRFDQHFEDRRYADAVRTFQADSSLQHQERALFRVGLAHASPESSVYQPARARELLERLLLLFPGTSYRDEARRLLALLREVERLEARTTRQSAEIERQRAEITELRWDIDRLEERLDRETAQVDLLRKIVERLEADLRDREAELRALREELKRLKEIDLKPSPSSGSGPATVPRDSTAPRPAAADPDTTGRR